MKDKKCARIVLIPTISFPISKASVYIPLGLLTIKAYIKSEADVMIVDPTLLIKKGALCANSSFYASFAEYLQRLNADLYAFSTKAGSYIQTITVAETLKQCCPTKLVALGGPQASVCDVATMETCNIDFIIRGEGEKPFLMLAKALSEGSSICNIPSLTFKDHRNPDVDRIVNLDDLPLPEYEEYRNYYSDYLKGKPEYDIQSYVPIDSGRGCPSACKFCYSPAMWKKKCRMKSAERLFEEVKYLYDTFDVTSVFFTEDNFTVNKKRTTRFCELLFSSGINVSWSCYSRIDTVDRETILSMKKAGCRQIYYGVESGSENILKLLGKKYSTAEANSIISYSVNCGIAVTASYIIGFTEETERDIVETLNAFANSIILGAASKLHLIGIEYGTEYYMEVRDSMVFRPSLSPSLLKKEYLIDDAMYDRISSDKRVFSYFYLSSLGFFEENWIKKLRIEYNYSLFTETLKMILESLPDNFLFLHLNNMKLRLNTFLLGDSLGEKVTFFKDSLVDMLKLYSADDLIELAILEYEKWINGNKNIKMTSKTIVPKE